MKKLTLSVAALTIAMMSFGQTQCKSLTKDSIQCKNTQKGVEDTLCYLHNPNYKKTDKKLSVICDGVTKKNTSCKNKTTNKNGKCHLHGGKKD